MLTFYFIVIDAAYIRNPASQIFIKYSGDHLRAANIYLAGIPSENQQITVARVKLIR